MNSGWVAVQVVTGREPDVARQLSDLGYEQFMPTYQKLISVGRSKVNVPRALFPGYLFCRYKSDSRYRIVDASYVLRIVRHGGMYAAVADVEVDNVRRIVASEFRKEPWSSCPVGVRVSIRSGPLAGLNGTLVSHRGERRLVVFIELFSRGVAVEVDEQNVSVIGQ